MINIKNQILYRSLTFLKFFNSINITKNNERCRSQQTTPYAHCRVLPPGEFNGMIPEPCIVDIFSKFYDDSYNRFPIMLLSNEHKQMITITIKINELL